MSVLVVFGTRPEAIKLAPVLRALSRKGIPYRVCVTAQHRELLDPLLEFFRIPVHYDLEVMEPDQDLFHVTTETLNRLQGVLRRERPELLVVQGDTTTCFSAALAAFYERIPVAHVEAGLRTGDPRCPYPEEMNRKLTDHLSRWLFAPTVQAARNLRAEGLEGERIFITGNTAVDAVLWALQDERFRSLPLPLEIPEDRGLVLVTAHRRESFSQGLSCICEALRELVERHPHVEIVYPVHPNPQVREVVEGRLQGVPRVRLLGPLDYLPFLKLMTRATLILTDSGGIQEEAPTLGVPVLVLREKTERPEGLEAGVAKLVGTDPERILEEASRLLDRPEERARMAQAGNPYGDGKAAERIVRVLSETAEAAEAT